MFTTAQAYAGGCSPSALKHAARRNVVTRVRRGVYAHADTPTKLRDERAAALVYPGAPLSHASAARLRGIPLVAPGRPLPELTVPPNSNAKMPGTHPYRARLREHDVEVVEGVLVTSVARTVLDLARDYRLVTSVPAIDFVLHEKWATADELRDVLEFCRGWPRIARARRALTLCDSRAESPLESLSRLTFPSVRVPAPEPQVIMLDRYGHEVGRTDFYWDDFGVVGEADGLSKYVDNGVVVAEKERHEGLDDLRLEITRWDWTLVWREHALWRQRLEHAFERGRDRDRSGLARLWTPVSTPRIAVL